MTNPESVATAADPCHRDRGCAPSAFARSASARPAYLGERWRWRFAPDDTRHDDNDVIPGLGCFDRQLLVRRGYRTEFRLCPLPALGGSRSRTMRTGQITKSHPSLPLLVICPVLTPAPREARCGSGMQSSKRLKGFRRLVVSSCRRSCAGGAVTTKGARMAPAGKRRRRRDSERRRRSSASPAGETAEAMRSPSHSRHRRASPLTPIAGDGQRTNGP